MNDNLILFEGIRRKVYQDNLSDVIYIDVILIFNNKSYGKMVNKLNAYWIQKKVAWCIKYWLSGKKQIER